MLTSRAIESMTPERLAKLKAADLARPSLEMLPFQIDEAKTAEATRDELVAALESYLVPFAAPPHDDKGRQTCLCCETVICGLLGTFTWGLVNGEGSCQNCGWPHRAYHRVEGWVTFTRILPYHPDGIELRGPS